MSRHIRALAVKAGLGNEDLDSVLDRFYDVRSPGGSSSLQSAVNTVVHALKTWFAGKLQKIKKTLRGHVSVRPLLGY